MPTATIKTKPTKASVETYLASIKDPARKQDCLEITQLMTEISGEKPTMWGTSIVGFGNRHYTSASGREVDWMVIGFSSRKEAISFYLTCNLDELATTLKKLGKYKRGVGCLYVKSLEDIDRSVLKKLIAQALKT